MDLAGFEGSGVVERAGGTVVKSSLAQGCGAGPEQGDGVRNQAQLHAFEQAVVALGLTAQVFHGRGERATASGSSGSSSSGWSVRARKVCASNVAA